MIHSWWWVSNAYSASAVDFNLEKPVEIGGKQVMLEILILGTVCVFIRLTSWVRVAYFMSNGTILHDPKVRANRDTSKMTCYIPLWAMLLGIYLLTSKKTENTWILLHAKYRYFIQIIKCTCMCNHITLSASYISPGGIFSCNAGPVHQEWPRLHASLQHN